MTISVAFYLIGGLLLSALGIYILCTADRDYKSDATLPLLIAAMDFFTAAVCYWCGV